MDDWQLRKDKLEYKVRQQILLRVYDYLRTSNANVIKSEDLAYAFRLIVQRIDYQHHHVGGF